MNSSTLEQSLTLVLVPISSPVLGKQPAGSRGQRLTPGPSRQVGPRKGLDGPWEMFLHLT